ncbi:alanyl-tRNA editing protein [Halocatena marina]|uniref:alanyl-tRNA editing protein n=1 Tax=Halocatena marina TaxID=2934937 RepID=UPI0020103E43|nr:alanine--tRNA ligase-related protein [Halocatena marina]
MTTPAATDPETTRFEATVEQTDAGLVLDHSYFYPEGGGQPADRGTIAGVPVLDVQKRDGQIVHSIEKAETASIEVGATVECAIDERFRAYCRRAHTASHVLYGAGRRLLSDLGYGGFGITDEKVRVDFSTTTTIDDDILCDIEQRVNEVVWESRPVQWEELPREEALAHETIAFNTKTEDGIAGTDRIRVVTVDSAGHEQSEPWDVAACGGTHVQNTREIGPVTVLERSNPGEGLTRVEFAVGPAGIERRSTEKRVALDGARLLETNVSAVPDAIDRLQTERDDYSNELASLRERLVDARLDELSENTVERDGQTWLIGTVEGLDANGLAERAQTLAGETADVVALVNGSQLAVGTSDTDTADAGSIIESVTDEFGGGGGGSPIVAQGGGLGGNPEDIVAYLRADHPEALN